MAIGKVSAIFEALDHKFKNEEPFKSLFKEDAPAMWALLDYEQLLRGIRGTPFLGEILSYDKAVLLEAVGRIRAWREDNPEVSLHVVTYHSDRSTRERDQHVPSEVELIADRVSHVSVSKGYMVQVEDRQPPKDLWGGALLRYGGQADQN